MRTAKTDQTGRMPRLIWVFAGRTVTLLVLSWGGSCVIPVYQNAYLGIKFTVGITEQKQIYNINNNNNDDNNHDLASPSLLWRLSAFFYFDISHYFGYWQISK